MKIFLVGGAVRDQLLNLAVKERDWVVVGATPELMEARQFIAVGKNFPVFLHPDTKEEYALARTERKVKPGYHGFIFHADKTVTLEEDLQRRDLTINAMAYDENHTLIDPWGGRRDLKDKVLRHVSLAFAEDPVRLLRVARFAARLHQLGFVVAEETMQLMRTMCANGEVSALVPERVWRELETALGEPTPAEFFRVLQEAGAFEFVLPELIPLFSSKIRAEQALDAVNQVKKRTGDKHIVFAVLVVWAIWGEPERETLVNTLCRRIRVPNTYRKFLHAVIEMQSILTCKEISGENLLVFFNKSGLLRNPNLLKPLLLTAGFLEDSAGYDEQLKSARLELLSEACQILLSLDLGSVAEKCNNPQDIEKAVQATRLQALEQVIREQKA